LFFGETLKFLVIGRGIDYGGPINPADFAMFSEKIILPSLQMIKAWEDKKLVVGGLFAGQRAGVIIVESSSAEELSALLQQLPFWGQNTWEVIPLQTFQSGTEDVKRQIAAVKKMAGPPMPE
jgi:hypothetical protein